MSFFNLTAMVAAAAISSPQVDRADLDEIAARALDAFDAPGLAIAVVEEGEPSVIAGYGVRTIAENDPVTDETVFQIASITKAFTVAALALLAEEGVLSFDDPVTDHIPEFELKDPYVTQALNIRDLISHRSGLPLGGGDLLFWPKGDASMDEILAALAEIGSTAGFRDEFQYNNLLYLVAGEVVARASGMTWAFFIDERIFTPLGMDGCRATPEGAAELANRATPHMVADGAVEPTFFAGRAIGAAGGINCPLTDLAKWAAMWTQEGAPLFSGDTYRLLTQPITPLRPDGMYRKFAGSNFRAYAGGWFVSDYRGRLLLEHGGTAHGMTGRILIIPDEDFAVMAAANQWTSITKAAALSALDLALGEGDVDWIATFAGVGGSEPPAATKRAGPGRQISAYAGTYTDAWFGDMQVVQQGRDLRITFSKADHLTGMAQPVGVDRFLVRWDDRSLNADAFLLFRPNADGDIERVDMEWLDPNTDFSYDFHHLNLRKVSSGE